MGLVLRYVGGPTQTIKIAPGSDVVRGEVFTVIGLRVIALSDAAAGELVSAVVDGGVWEAPLNTAHPPNVGGRAIRDTSTTPASISDNYDGGASLGDFGLVVDVSADKVRFVWEMRSFD